MEQISFNKLLLKTAFSCMACDGDIDPKEVKLIKSLHEEKRLFGDIELDTEIEIYRKAINENISAFLKSYFNELTSTELLGQEELKLIEVAINTIKADEKIEYSEIKFFKVIRSKLKIENEAVLAIHPDFEEYLEQDIISESYLKKLQDDYFDTQVFTNFDFIKPFNIDFTDIIDKSE
jgi:uncharacterized tellurite resistance protein B-like protein